MNQMISALMMVPGTPGSGVAPSSNTGGSTPVNGSEFNSFLLNKFDQNTPPNRITVTTETAQTGLEELTGLIAHLGLLEHVSPIFKTPSPFATDEYTSTSVFESIIQQIKSGTPQADQLPAPAQAVLATIDSAFQALKGNTLSPVQLDPSLLQQLSALQAKPQGQGDIKPLHLFIQSAFDHIKEQQHHSQPGTAGGPKPDGVGPHGDDIQPGKIAGGPKPDGVGPHGDDIQPGTPMTATTTSNGIQQASQGATAPTQTLAPSLAPSLAQLNVGHIGVQIAQHYLNGKNRFEIRIDPPEMGRVDVRMDIDRSGQVTARLTVERLETLEALQRDSRALERALQESGLDLDSSNLSFCLKNQQEQHNGPFEQFAFEDDDTSLDKQDEDHAQNVNSNIIHYKLQLSPSQLDMHV